MVEKSSPYKILWFFLSLMIISVLLIGWLLLPFLSIIVMAAVVAGVFRPVYRFFEVKDMITPPFASFLTCVVMFFVLFVPIVFLLGVLANEAQELYQMAKEAVVSGQINALLKNSEVFGKAKLLLEKVNIQLTADGLNQWIAESGQNMGLYLLKQVRLITANMLRFLGSFFFMLLIAYYFLLDGKKIVAFIIDLSPLPKDQDEKLISKFNEMSGAVLIGNGLCGIIQGTLGGTVFALFGLKSAFLWGMIMVLLAFLPILGIGFVFMPAAVFLFLKGKVWAGIFFVVFYMVLSFGTEYLVKPKLVGSRVKMHTLLVFLAIIGGLKLFGLLGIIYGPLIITFFLTLTDIYHASYQKMVEPVQ